MINTIINTIPEFAGWIAVGVAGTLCAIAMVALGKTIIKAIKMRLEDEEEIEE